MADLLANVLGFGFILLLPLVVIAGAVVTLFAVGALFDALDHPQELRGRIDAAFRRPPRPPRMTGPDHYYQPYWSGRG
jgi:hypothetical protein